MFPLTTGAIIHPCTPDPDAAARSMREAIDRAQPAPRGDIPTAARLIDSIRQVLDEAETRVGKLENSLAPVLRPAPTDPNQAPPAAMPGVPMLDDLATAIDRLIAILNRLMSIDDRLAL